MICPTPGDVFCNPRGKLFRILKADEQSGRARVRELTTGIEDGAIWRLMTEENGWKKVRGALASKPIYLFIGWCDGYAPVSHVDGQTLKIGASVEEATPKDGTFDGSLIFEIDPNSNAIKSVARDTHCRTKATR